MLFSSRAERTSPPAGSAPRAHIAAVLALGCLSLGAPCGASSFFAEPVQLHPISSPKSVAIGDVNNDSHPDIVLLSDDGDSVQTFLGGGDGTFPVTVGSPISPFYGADGYNLVLGQFNADTNLDVVWSSGLTVLFQAGDGTGGFGAWQATAGPGNYPAHVAVGDFNEDTILDLVVSYEEEPGSVAIHLGNGDGTFDGGTAFATSPYPEGIAVAHLNSDTHLDLAVACVGGSVSLNVVSVLLGNGDGSFSGKVDFTVNLTPTAVVAGDFNGDAKTDLATAGRDGKVAVVLGNGAGSFGTKTEYTVGQFAQAIATADLDGDGKLDLLVPDSGLFGGGTQLAILRGVGDGTFEAPEFVPTGQGPQDIAVADVNHDGRPDAIVPNLYTNLTTFDWEASLYLNCVPCTPTAVSVVLDRIEAMDGVVRTRWVLPSGSVVFGTVQRKTDGGDWVSLGAEIRIDTDKFEYEDRSVTPGLRYAYRLSLRDDTDAWYSNEAWIFVPTIEAAPGRLPWPITVRRSSALSCGMSS